MSGRQSPTRRPARRPSPERRAVIRRRRAAAVAALLLVVVLIIVIAVVTAGGKKGGGGTGGHASPTPSPRPSATALRTPTAARPLRLMNYGDSMGGELGWALVPLARQTGVIKVWTWYKVSSSLVKPEFFSWPAYLRNDLPRRHLDAAVFLVGTNDGQGMVADGKVLAFGSKPWVQEYRRRVGAVMDLFLKQGVKRVYWVGMPIMRSPGFSSVMKVIDTAGAAEAARRRSQVTFIDAWKLFSTSAGAYDSQWRHDDGIHYSIAGTQRLAQAVFDAIKRDWRIK